MITIHDGNWKVDIDSTIGSILIPVAGKYTFLGGSDRPLNSTYNLVPSSLKWFLHNYCLKSSMTDLVKAAMMCFNITSTFKYHKSLSDGLLMSAIPKEIIPNEITLTRQFLDSKPNVISLSVCNSLYAHGLTGDIDDNYLVNLDDSLIKRSIIDALTTAVRECMEKKLEDVIITPLFSEGGYKPNKNNWEVL